MRGAVSFRSLQAIHDLRHVARKANESTLGRIAAGLSGAATAGDLRRLIREDGCMLGPEMAGAAHQALVLAATLPDDDHEAFRTATAILLADRLQFGEGADDLFWHWDAFQAQYQTLSQPDRAAVMQGFRCAQEEGLVALFDPPSGDDLTTEPGSALLTELITLAGETRPRIDPSREDFAAGVSAMIARGFDDTWVAGHAARAWPENYDSILRLDAPQCRLLLRGFRHLYEWHEDWDPYPGERFDPAGATPRLLPVLAN